MDLPRVHGVPPSSLAWEGTAVSAEEEEDVQEAQLVDEVKRARALEHVQTLMRTHTGLEAVQTAACNAIVDVALAAKVCQEGVGQLGVLEDAKRQMRRHADNAPVQKAACRATYSIALRNAANLQGAGKIGVMVDIQEAFRQHCDRSDVLLEACTAICSMTVHSANQMMNKAAESAGGAPEGHAGSP
mmetsp:Transcript_6658/g.17286  ORF Transcript_6658/g.17286 Transcript_6658/m.17286 type:complete len:187 (-) Transcript_6658:799-1359(-)